MLETLVYFAAAVFAVIILAQTVPQVPLIQLIVAVAVLTGLLATARHGPAPVLAFIKTIAHTLRP